MRGQTPAFGQCRGLLHIVKRQQLTTQGVFQRQQPGARKVGVVGFDGGLNV